MSLPVVAVVAVVVLSSNTELTLVSAVSRGGVAAKNNTRRANVELLVCADLMF